MYSLSLHTVEPIAMLHNRESIEYEYPENDFQSPAASECLAMPLLLHSVLAFCYGSEYPLHEMPPATVNLYRSSSNFWSPHR